MPIKFLPLSWGFWVFLEGGGVEVPILFLWGWGFFRRKGHPCPTYVVNFGSPKRTSTETLNLQNAPISELWGSTFQGLGGGRLIEVDTVRSLIVTYRSLILSELIKKKLPIPLPILYCFELIKVTVVDRPVSVLSPSLSELPKSYRFVILGI